MNDSFDGVEYARYLRDRWWFAGAACAAAVVLALAVSLLLPKKYTATARILIEPPGGSDQRVAVAVSPIYLESLKTYVQFATSDSLFLRAMEHFHLRDRHSGPIEKWKKSVLAVEIPRNTRILEISATLADPKTAHEFALFLARQTTELTRTVNLASDKDLLANAQGMYQEAQRRLERASSEWQQEAAREPLGALDEEIKARSALRAELMRSLEMAGTLIAEDRERQKTAAAGERAAIAGELDLARARAADLRTRIAGLDRDLTRRQAEVARRTARSEALLAERKDAEASLAAAETHLREVRAAAGNRSEQLEIVDPGIAPERPSAPNLPLNGIAAFLLALTVSLGGLTLRFGLSRKAPPARTGLHAAVRHG